MRAKGPCDADATPRCSGLRYGRDIAVPLAAVIAVDDLANCCPMAQGQRRTFEECVRVKMHELHAERTLEGEYVRSAKPDRVVGWRWDEPSDAEVRTHAHHDDAIRDAACAFTVAALAHFEGLTIVGKAEHGTGADLIAVNTDDEAPAEFLLIEVKGLTRGSRESKVNSALKRLQRQSPAQAGLAVAVDLQRGSVLVKDHAPQDAT